MVNRLITKSYIPLKIVGIYFLFGGLWIFLSDKILLWLFSNPDESGNLQKLTNLQNYKGWFFIILTGAILYFLISRETSRTQTSEKARQQSELRYLKLIEIANDGIWSIDKDGRVIFVNRKMAEMLGYNSTEEILGKRFTDFMDEKWKVRAEKYFELRKSGVAGQVDFRLKKRDGSDLWVIVATTPVFENDKFVSVLAMMTDITERKLAEENLQKIEDRYHALASNAETVWIADNKGKILRPAELFEEQTGVRYDEVDYYWWIKAIHPAERAETVRRWEHSVRTKEVYEIENRVLIEGNGYKHFFVRAVPVLNSDGSIREWIGMNISIEERKQAEEALYKSEQQLIQIQRLESIGQLAGGVAHDFNNMLTAIIGYGELTLRAMPENESLRHNIEEILKASKHSADLTRQLLAFSRRQILQPEVVNINEVIKGILKMLERLIGEDIKLVSDFEPDIKPAKVDPVQLTQVIVNLAVNARDAMPEGGTLTIKTENVFIDEEHLRLYPDSRIGHNLLISVSDTGIGISREMIEHIFEPFFTTKQYNKGTGLGLSTVYGIVKQSGGNILVESKFGKGTTFKVYLPQVDEEADSLTKHSDSSINDGSELILLVEDEDAVRRVTSDVLKSKGYQVLEAQNGIEAFEIFEKFGEKINLLLTDVVMPKMGGRELAESLILKFPDLHVIFMSGYTDDAIIRKGIMNSNSEFIQKPFTTDALTEKIRKVLDK